MSDDTVREMMLRLDRADALAQIRFWERIYRQSSFEPQVPRISVPEFYDSVMPRFSLWLRNQTMYSFVLVLIVALVILGIKHASDHVKYQDAVIEFETRAIELELGNDSQARWYVARILSGLPGFGDELFIDICGTCTAYREALSLVSASHVENIEAAHHGKSRLFNRPYIQFLIALAGVITAYYLIRKMLDIRAVIRATRDLNDRLMESDPNFRQLG